MESTKISPDIEAYLKLVPPAAAMLGREFVSLDPASGEVRLSYFAKPEFANRHGTVQGGLLAAMLDSATASAVLVSLAPELTILTMSLNTSFERPAPLGKLLAAARVLGRDERSAVVEAEIMDTDHNVLARANARLRILPRKR